MYLFILFNGSMINDPLKIEITCTYWSLYKLYYSRTSEIMIRSAVHHLPTFVKSVKTGGPFSMTHRTFVIPRPPIVTEEYSIKIERTMDSRDNAKFLAHLYHEELDSLVEDLMIKEASGICTQSVQNRIDTINEQIRILKDQSS